MLALDILKQICHIPTASFYEEKIRNKLLTICKKLFEDKVTITEDKYGNVIVHYKGDPNRDNPKSIAYVAHIDHPAFHIENNLLRMMGGLNSEVVVGCPVTLISKDHSQKEKTKITETIKDGEKIKYRTGKEDLSKFAFAILDLPELTTINNVIKAPVLDDLAGVAMSLAALKEIVDNKTKSDVYVVLHIAEEVGLIGAYLIAKQKLLPKETFVISIETSSYKKGKEVIAKVGNGIVIRQGDARIPAFNVQALEILR
ncbi:hypothetical protein HOC32_03495, partial [Candidatus Woesearchaeota archaeon]|nr:hypothetical protein [Candidatus Woesearchaeota archaeon]